MIRRREFITLLGGSAAAWPIAARAQQAMRRIGILEAGSRTVTPGSRRVDALREGLADLGWTKDRNIQFQERWANGNADLLPVYAGELVRLVPDVICVSNSACLRAMRHATSDIPIVFSVVADPVGQGFVSSLARPGGNITGFASAEFDFSTKILETLKRLAPKVERVGALYDPAAPQAAGMWSAIGAAAPSFALAASKLPVRTADEIERAIAAFVREPNGGLYVVPSPATALYQQMINTLALQHRLPTVFEFRYFVESGGLASYGPDDNDMARRAASYVDRILKGEKPRDLPVQLPTKFQFVVNLKTAKTIGLDIPPTVVALADEVIE
jgi:putative ABC transport system substrate-binding protein